MNKSLMAGLAVVGVAAVAGAAVWTTGGGDFLKGSLKDLPKPAAQQQATQKTAPVTSTAGKPAVPGKTDQYIRLGHKCLMFQPMNLAQKGKDGFVALVPGTNFLNGIKAVSCDSDAKIKGMTVKFKGSNVELNSLKLKKDNVELNSSLSRESMQMMGDLQNQMKGSTMVEKDIEFRFNQPVELNTDTSFSLEADVKSLGVNSYMSTEMMSVDYYDAQMSQTNNTIDWEGYNANTKDSNMMKDTTMMGETTMMKDNNMIQMKVDKTGRQNLADSLEAVELQAVAIE